MDTILSSSFVLGLSVGSLSLLSVKLGHSVVQPLFGDAKVFTKVFHGRAVFPPLVLFDDLLNGPIFRRVHGSHFYQSFDPKSRLLTGLTKMCWMMDIVPTVADIIYTRGEVIEALQTLGLTRAWLAARINESKQNVHNWLNPSNPTDPQDPTVWERMTDALIQMGKPKTAIPDDLREMGIELGLAVLSGDDETARRIAPEIIRQLSRNSPDPRSKKR